MSPLPRLLLAALLVGACRSASEPVIDPAASIMLTPSYVTWGGPGTRTVASVDVRGIGATPTITWTSLAPDAVIIDSVRDAGRAAFLRFEQPRATLVIVTARGTRVLVDTLFVTIPAVRAAE